MKKINFVTTLSNSQDRSVVWWFLITTSLVCGLCFITIIYGIRMGLHYYTLRHAQLQLEQQIKGSDIMLSNHEQAIKQKQELEDQLAITKKAITTTNLPMILLDELVQQAPIKITSFALQEQRGTIQAMSGNSAQVVAFLEQMQKNEHIKSAHLTSLQPQGNALSCTIQFLTH